MAPTITRLVLSLALIVAAPVFYTVIFIVWLEATSHRNDEIALMISNVVVGLSFAVGWTVIWLGEVRWGALRITLTGAVVFGSCILAAVIGFVIATMVREEELGILFGGMLWVVFWLFGTALVWMELPAERRRRLASVGAAEVACPTCGYNLKGLKTTGCPECGSSFTIDQLFASHVERRKKLGES